MTAYEILGWMFQNNPEFDRFMAMVREEEWDDEGIMELAAQQLSRLYTGNCEIAVECNCFTSLHLSLCLQKYRSQITVERSLWIVFASMETSNVSLIEVQCAIWTLVGYEDYERLINRANQISNQ